MFDENKQYGFWRNLRALRPIGIWVSIAAVAALGLWTVIAGLMFVPLVCLAGSVLLTVLWIFLPTEARVRGAADRYAVRLFNAAAHTAKKS